MNLHETLVNAHGSAYAVCLQRLGANAAEIERKYQTLYDNGEYAADAWVYNVMHETIEDAAARECWNEICSTALEMWVRSMHKATAIAINNALSVSPASVIMLFEGIELSDRGFVWTWNKYHADDKIEVESC